METRIAGFDWDEGNRAKCEKRGLTAAEIEAFFARAPRVAPDLKHSTSEDRFIAIGRTTTGRPIFVAFALRATSRGSLIRPVSARYMHRKEITKYEKAIPNEGSAAEN